MIWSQSQHTYLSSDLYYLVKFLPAYSFPPNMPSIEQSLARMDRFTDNQLEIRPKC